MEQTIPIPESCRGCFSSKTNCELIVINKFEECHCSKCILKMACSYPCENHIWYILTSEISAGGKVKSISERIYKWLEIKDL